MQHTPPRVASAALALTLLLTASATGCGSDEAAAPGGTTTTASLTAATDSGTTSDTSAPTAATELWAGGPDPCLLLSRAETSAVLGFPAEPLDVAVKPADGASAAPALGRSCAWRDSVDGYRGGYIAITLFGPDADMTSNREAWADVEDVADVGASAYVGTYDQGLGEGTNSAFVVMGDGAILLNVFAYQTLDKVEVIDLARLAAARWELDRDGDIPTQGAFAPDAGDGAP